MTDWSDGPVRVLVGDARARLAELEPESVQCVVTSPPYWGLRDYGTGTWEGGDPAGPGTPDTSPPTAPSNLTATAAGSSQINLAWTASTDDVGVTGYQVERCQGSGCSGFAQVASVGNHIFFRMTRNAQDAFEQFVDIIDKLAVLDTDQFHGPIAAARDQALAINGKGGSEDPIAMVIEFHQFFAIRN